MSDIKNDRCFFYWDNKLVERHVSKKYISEKLNKNRQVRRCIEDLHFLQEIKQQSSFDLSLNSEVLKSYFNTIYKLIIFCKMRI
ncbi:hypothetical protein SHVI106290_05355 [Shewanella violacea]|uniref:Uncharacterized protein n=1 Tax=Shewanella violacea (strain JCM 10179 / CIP 106290 / LMG 19151 / DSS12) TaxID=637905 RepID=D4ZMA3_SHEVD|nr:hypothetical protein SVI_2831 [Shewanella violacea DSS12]